MTKRRGVSFLLVFVFCLSALAEISPGSGKGAHNPRVIIDWGDEGHASPASRTPRIVAKELDAARLASFVAKHPTPLEWNALFAVFVLAENGVLPADQPPLLGRYHAAGSTLQFLPKYPLVRGMKLRARLDARILGETHQIVDDLTTDLIPSDGADPASLPSPSVKFVSPASNVLPENLLRFYIQFSHPMSRGEAYRHLQLLDDAGTPVKDPFLELDEELWSPDGKRFTLLFDPGRIKRGLKPREEVGPILQEGRSYTLVVGKHWPDAGDRALACEYRKTFRVGPPDSTPPDPATWKLKNPAGASLDPLVVEFPEPLDQALTLRLISVMDSAGRFFKGRADLDESQTRWSFTPSSPWKTAGNYSLQIGTDLEDLAGNGVGRPFEVDMTEPITSRVTPVTVNLPIRVGAAAR